MNTGRTDPPAQEPVALLRPQGLTVVVGRRFVVRVLVPLVLGFAAVSLLLNVLVLSGQVGTGVGEFLLNRLSVDRELTLPTLLQGALLLACAASAWTVRGAPVRGSRRHGWGWTFLTLAFLYLCVDELLGLHERLIKPLRQSLDLGGALYFSWVVVAVPLVAVIGVVLLPFVRSLPRSTRSGLVLAGVLYVGGAAGMEMVGGLVTSWTGAASTPYLLSTTLEELLEMLGMLTFLVATGTHYVRYSVPAAAGGATSSLPTGSMAASS